MKQVISKSQFKPQVLEYLRMVEKTKKSLIITHGGKPVVKVIPIKEDDEDEKILIELRNSVIFYNDPTEPVNIEAWEALK